MVDFFQNWWKGGDLEANNFSPAGYLQCEFPGKIIHKIFDDASLLVRVSKNFLVRRSKTRNEHNFVNISNEYFIFGSGDVC